MMNSQKMVRALCMTLVSLLLALGVLLLWIFLFPTPYPGTYSEAPATVPQPPAPVVIEEQPATETWEEAKQRAVDEFVVRTRAANSAMVTNTLAQYEGLPEPKEDAVSIQTYSSVVISRNGTQEIFALLTFSKDPAMVSDFSGEPATVETVHYSCTTSPWKCSTTDLLTSDAVRAASMEGDFFMHCLLGWDEVRHYLFSTRCGEGGDFGIVTRLNYETGELRAAEYKDGSQMRFLGFNRSLSHFVALKMRDDAYRIDVFAADNLDAPSLGADLPSPTQGGKDVQWTTSIDWRSDDLATVGFDGRWYRFNVKTGELTAL